MQEHAVVIGGAGPTGMMLAGELKLPGIADAQYSGRWELPVLGPITPPTALLIRPDGYVAWVGESNQVGLAEALNTWFGPPAVV